MKPKAQKDPQKHHHRRRESEKKVSKGICKEKTWLIIEALKTIQRAKTAMRV
jgi:hypothetical protein